jgi:hypothetical protein
LVGSAARRVRAPSNVVASKARVSRCRFILFI